MGFFGPSRIGELSRPSISELRKRTRILVIDDDVNSFPGDLLRKEGYAIDWWPKVMELGRLENGDFDIIFLDIGGVAQDYSPDDGLGILEHVKKTNPSQIIVAFSGQSFDLSKNRFWQLADDSLSKPVDVTKCKRLIDHLIEEKVTPMFYWGAIKEILKNHGLSEKKLKKLEREIVRAAKADDKGNLSEALRPVLSGLDVATRIVQIAMKIVELTH